MSSKYNFTRHEFERYCYVNGLNAESEHGEKVYRREGHRYVVEPIGLVFHEDNYYLMIYSARHGNTANCVTACFLDLCRAIWMSANAFKQLNYRLREVTSWKNNL